METKEEAHEILRELEDSQGPCLMSYEQLTMAKCCSLNVSVQPGRPITDIKRLKRTSKLQALSGAEFKLP